MKCSNTHIHSFPAPEAIYESIPDGLWTFCESCKDKHFEELYPFRIRRIDIKEEVFRKKKRYRKFPNY